MYNEYLLNLIQQYLITLKFVTPYELTYYAGT